MPITEKRKEYLRLYRAKNKEKIRNQKKIKDKQYYLNNKDRIKEYKKRWYAKNKQRVNQKLLEKIHSDPKIKLDVYIGNAIRKQIKQNGLNKDGRKWEELVGYTAEELKQHLERHFLPEMNWDNYGSYWHIDHVKPKSWFKYDSISDEQFKKCWSLNNLQPMKACDNMKKKNFYEG